MGLSKRAYKNIGLITAFFCIIFFSITPILINKSTKKKKNCSDPSDQKYYQVSILQTREISIINPPVSQQLFPSTLKAYWKMSVGQIFEYSNIFKYMWTNKFIVFSIRWFFPGQINLDLFFRDLLYSRIYSNIHLSNISDSKYI